MIHKKLYWEYGNPWRITHWHPVNNIICISKFNIYTNGIYLQFADDPSMELVSIYHEILDGNYAEWCLSNWRITQCEADRRNRIIRRSTIAKKAKK